MNHLVDVTKLQAQYAYATAPILKGILKVLTDMHCKNMSDGEAAKYMKELHGDMDAFQEAIKKVVK